MKRVHAQRISGCRMAGLALWAIGMGGCGVLGSPMPPEDVGVSPVIERQLRREGLLSSGSNVVGSASRPSAPSGITIEEDASPIEPGPLPVPRVREMGTRL